MFCALFFYLEGGLKCKTRSLVCKIQEPQTVLQERADVKFAQQLLF